MRQRIADDGSGFTDLFPGSFPDRIEVEVKVVGTVHVVAPGVPLIEIDAAKIDHPEKRTEVVDHWKVDDVPGGMLDGAGFDPFGSRLGRPLHKKELAGRAMRVPLHD